MQAVIVAAIAVATLIAVQILVAAAGAVVLAAATVSYVVVGAGHVLYARARGGVALVGLARPRARFLVAGALIGLATWYLGLRLVEWLEPPGDMAPIDRMIERTALAPSLLAIAVLPAITEELVFRGVLARGLASRLPIAAAVVLSAVLFSTFHLIPRQMVAVFPLGLALGYLAIRADSVVSTMLAHLANNAIVILAASGNLGVLEHVPAAGLLGAAIAVVAVGLALAATGRA